MRLLSASDPQGKTALTRVDFNVPMHVGKITDATRIERALPTLRWLIERKARVALLSHFGRPEGKYAPAMSLAPLVDALKDFLPGVPIGFGVDCVGAPAREAIAHTPPGGVVLLENLRFHPEEEAGEDAFARDMASLGDMYVNEAFSCSHRAHASVAGIPRYLPAYAGLGLSGEIAMLERLLAAPERPLAAVIGGSKISTKLDLLKNLLACVDILIVGGAMANTFLAAAGRDMGASRVERPMLSTAKAILAEAEKRGCRVLLPKDAVAARALAPAAPCQIVPVEAMPPDAMALDLGPETLCWLAEELASCRTLVWNGPLGAFETSPFDASTVFLARVAAGLTQRGALHSVAGGGDTAAALAHAGLKDGLSHLSTGGGAFLEWLEGRTLPGVAALEASPAAP